MAQGNWGPGFVGGVGGAKGKSVMEGLQVRAVTLSLYSLPLSRGRGVPDCSREEENQSAAAVSPPVVSLLLTKTLTQMVLTQQGIWFFYQ